MKKIINKLFELLGYKLLSKKEYDAMDEVLKYTLWLVSVHKNRTERVMKGISYCVECGVEGYYVVDDDCYLIKYIPFDDDKDYAKLCAEELCEMLNQKI